MVENGTLMNIPKIIKYIPRSMTGILFVTMHSPKAVYPNTNDQGHESTIFLPTNLKPHKKYRNTRVSITNRPTTLRSK